MAAYDRSKPWIRRIFHGKNAVFFIIIAVTFIALNIFRLNDPIPVGVKINNFSLTTLKGETFYIYDVKVPKILVFYKKHKLFSNYMYNYYYRKLLPQLKILQDNNYAQVIVIAEGYDSVEKMRELADDKNHIVLKEIGYIGNTEDIAKQFGIRSWPHLFLLGSDSKVLYESKLASAEYLKSILWRN